MFLNKLKFEKKLNIYTFRRIEVEKMMNSVKIKTVRIVAAREKRKRRVLMGTVVQGIRQNRRKKKWPTSVHKVDSYNLQKQKRSPSYPP